MLDKQLGNRKIKKVALFGAIAVYVVLALLALSVVYSVVAVVMAGNLMEFVPTVLLPGLLSLALTAGLLYVFVQISLLMRSLRKDYSPFVQQNVKRLKRVALALAVLGAVVVLGDIGGAIWSAAILARLAAPAGGASSVGIIGGADGPTAVFVTRVSQPFTVSGVMMLLVALAVYCIALVFEYGAELQRQSDETL